MKNELYTVSFSKRMGHSKLVNESLNFLGKVLNLFDKKLIFKSSSDVEIRAPQKKTQIVLFTQSYPNFSSKQIKLIYYEIENVIYKYQDKNSNSKNWIYLIQKIRLKTNFSKKNNYE